MCLERKQMSLEQSVTPEDLARFATISAGYGYWNATPKENAAVGIQESF